MAEAAPPAAGAKVLSGSMDLSNCEREPIHTPGQIQAHGVLLALCAQALTVLQASDNSAAYLGRPAEALLGQGAAALLGEERAAELRRRLGADSLEDNPLFLFTAPVCGAGPFHVIGHVRDGALLLELEPPPPASAPRPDFYELLKRSIARFQGARTVREFSQVVAEEVRRVSGYDRVLVYEFGADWRGHIIAESLAPPDDPAAPRESYLGLLYPASDIPAQARALFLLNTVRMLPDALYAPSRLVPELSPRTGRPFDLSHTFLRGASRMYTEFLVNMGARASLTLALVLGERLWGLVVCHHFTPRHIPYDARAACELLARVVSGQLAHKLRIEEDALRRRSTEAYAAVVQGLAVHEDMDEGLLGCSSIIAGLIDRASVAVIARGRVRSVGPTPDEAQLRALGRWLSEAQPADVFVTDSLPSLYPPAAAFTDTACGLLAVPISRASGEYVLWMRPELVRTERWAGDPRKPVETGPDGDRITPRKSFALWIETVRGRSAPFSELEREAAGRLRTAMAETLLLRSDQALRASEAYRGSVIDSLEDQVVALDPQGVIVDVNLAWRRAAAEGCLDPATCGIGADYRLQCERATVGDEFARAALQGIRDVSTGRREKFSLEYPCHSPERRRWFTLRVSRAAGRAPGSVVITHTDVTTVKETEERLRLALREKEKLVREVHEKNQNLEEANRLKSEFLANMSHELRTPLNGIIGFSELMSDGKAGAVSPVQREYLGDVLSSARHLHALINDVLDLAKVESGKLEFHPEPLDLGEVLRDAQGVLRPLAAGKRITLRTYAEPSLKGVLLDASRLRQVLFNYASNAIKFTPDGGQVQLRALPEGPGAVRLEVEDSGVGIRPEDMPRLFVEFQQLDASRAKKHPGTGLGLALTKRIVEAQGGRVGARSEPGEGSVFYAVLPRAPVPAEALVDEPIADDLDSVEENPAHKGDIPQGERP